MASTEDQQSISVSSAFSSFPTSLKYLALIVVGEPFSAGNADLIAKEIEKGLRNWDIDADTAEYDMVLRELSTAQVTEDGSVWHLSQHKICTPIYCVKSTGNISMAEWEGGACPVLGQMALETVLKVHQYSWHSRWECSCCVETVHRIVSYAGSQLGIVVHVNPTHSAVTTELQHLLIHPASHKNLIYGGLAGEGTGDWMLHDDTLTLTDISEVFADPQVDAAILKSDGAEKSTLVLSNCHWSANLVAKQAFSKSLNLTINPSESKHDLESISELVDSVRSHLVVLNPFQLLEPPTMGVGVKCKITKPTVLVFPASKGDCGFFAVGDFSIFIGGGYCMKSCFWKFAKHLNRVDAVLLPNMNPNCLLGVNSFLERKLSEAQLEQPEPDSQGFEDWQTNCNSPELGVVYLNAPAIKKTPAPSITVKSFALGYQTVKLSKELGSDPISCYAGTGKTLEPVTLFQKVGIGRLDMYVLSPTQNSKEVKDFFTQWSSGKAFGKVKTGVKVNDKDAELSLLDAVSICALIVWQPWDPEEDIVRVLFPGNAPQNKIIEGLDKLKHLDFLKYREVNKIRLLNGGKPVQKKKTAPSTKSTPKTNGSAKKSPSPTKEENVCEDGIHCNTPPPSPTGASTDGIQSKVSGDSSGFIPIRKCEDGVNCNTPPPEGVCTDGKNCNTPPPDGGVCTDGENCNTPPPEEEQSNIFIPIGKCEDGKNCNTPPPEDGVCRDGKNCNTPPPQDGVCEDGENCNTPPPEEEQSNVFIPIGKCEDGENCNTPPPEDGVCRDGKNCNTPPPEDGVCRDGKNCNTPPPEEDANGIQLEEGSADPVQVHEGDAANAEHLMEEIINVKDASLDSSERKDEEDDLNEAGSSGHGTAAATPEQMQSPVDPSGGFIEESNPDDPSQETSRVTDANHNLELAIGGATPDVIHDSSGIDTEDSPSPDQHHSWESSAALLPESKPVMPPDVIADHSDGENVDQGEDMEGKAALAEVTSDAVGEVVHEGEEESSEDVSQESEIEIKPSQLPEEPPPDVSADLLGDMPTLVSKETENLMEEETKVEFAEHRDVDLDPTLEHVDVSPQEVDIKLDETENVSEPQLEDQPQMDIDFGQLNEAVREEEPLESIDHSEDAAKVMEDEEFDPDFTTNQEAEMLGDIITQETTVPGEEAAPQLDDDRKEELEVVDAVADVQEGDMLEEEIKDPYSDQDETSEGTNVDQIVINQSSLVQTETADTPVEDPDLCAEEGEVKTDTIESAEGEGESETDVLQKPPAEAVFDDLLGEKGEIEDDSLEVQLETEDDSLEVKVGTTEEHSLDAVSEDKDAYQEKESGLLSQESEKEDNSMDIQDLEVPQEEKPENVQEEDSLEVDVKEQSNSEEPLSEGLAQEEFIPEETPREDHSIEEEEKEEEERSRNTEEEKLGSDQIQIEVQPPDEQESESSPLSEDIDQNVSAGLEKLPQQQEMSSGEDHNLVDICVESAPAAVDVSKYPADKEPKEEEEGNNSEIDRIFAQPEPHLLHDDHQLITESQNTSDGVLEIEDVSAASEEIPAEVVTTSEEASPPVIPATPTTPATPDTPTLVPVVQPLVKETPVKEADQVKPPVKKNVTGKKGTKDVKSDGKKLTETKPKTTKTSKLDKTSRTSLTGKTTTARKTDEKKIGETKTGSARKSLEKRSIVKKTQVEEKKTEREIAKKKAGIPEKRAATTKVTSRPSPGVKTETRKPLSAAKTTTTRKSETQRPGQTGKPNGPTRRSVETTKRTTTVKTTRTTAGKGDSRTNGSKRATSATKGSTAGKTQSIPNSGPAVYVDLTYIPNHGAVENVNSEFFRRVRSKYYVMSGNDKSKQRPNIAVLHAFLEGKLKWEDVSEVSTLIPTHDVDCIREWQLNKQEEINKANIEIAVPATRSIVQMKDENFFMYKVEFDQNGLE